MSKPRPDKLASSHQTIRVQNQRQLSALSRYQDFRLAKIRKVLDLTQIKVKMIIIRRTDQSRQDSYITQLEPTVGSSVCSVKAIKLRESLISTSSVHIQLSSHA